MENVLALMKLKINKEPYVSINNLDSMENRVVLLIKRKSDYINYQDDAHIMQIS
jgi:hypothetical protein